MHIAFLGNPASGEVNVQLATAQELVQRDHDVTFLMAESCRRKVNHLKANQLPHQKNRVRFISLGSTHAVEDLTRENSTSFSQGRMNLMRRKPGDYSSLQACLEADLGPAEEHAAAATLIRDFINSIDPDIICVDILTSSAITGIRLTNRKYILTIPCSPGLTALPTIFGPHPVAANRGRSWKSLSENIYLRSREYIHSRTHPDRRARHKIISKGLGLQSYGPSYDTWLFAPYWEDENCVAGIHFNTPGLSSGCVQSHKMILVGAGLSVEALKDSQVSPECNWMDEALNLGHDVVYVNMGSMFMWETTDLLSCIAGFKAAYHKLGGGVRFLLKIRNSTAYPIELSSTALPSYIRLTEWVQDQRAIYSHPALKVFVHHGGGNSFNEAVFFGIPQLILSQWLDTHEYAIYAQRFGLGLCSQRPPLIEAGDIEAKIIELLGPSRSHYKANCETWSVRNRIAGGARSAAEIIMTHGRSQVSRPSQSSSPVALQPSVSIERKA